MQLMVALFIKEFLMDLVGIPCFSGLIIVYALLLSISC